MGFAAPYKPYHYKVSGLKNAYLYTPQSIHDNCLCTKPSLLYIAQIKKTFG